jgi:hypothetical protein
MSTSTRRFSLLPLFAMVAVSAACSDATAPGASLSPEAPHFAITIDLEGGTGFVGKGDVQSFFGWNNPQMQAAASGIEFRYRSDAEWTCSKPHPVQPEDIVQERSTTVRAASTVIGRENSQGLNGPWSGFILTFGSTQTQGPALGSCPDDNSEFEFDDNLTEVGGLQIRFTSGASSPTSTGKTINTWYNFPS